MKLKRRLRNDKAKRSITIEPFENVVDVENELSGSFVGIEPGQPEAVNVHIVPRHDVEVFGLPFSAMTHSRITLELSGRCRDKF